MVKNKKINNKIVFYVCAVAWPVLQFLIFYLCVNFNSIMLAFKKFEYSTSTWSFVGFENFNQVITDFTEQVALQQVMKNTIQLFLISLVTKLLPLIMSYYLFKKYPLHGVFKVFLFIPQIISPIALAVCFQYFVEIAVPEFWEILFDEKIKGLLTNLDTEWGTLLFYNVWFGIGAQFLLYTGAMSGISDSVLEAAQLDGVNPIQEFIFIVFPLIYSTFVTFIVTSFAVIFTNQMNLFSFYGPGAEYSVSTIGYLLYTRTLEGTLGDYPYLAAFGLCLTFIAIPLCFGMRFLLKKLGPKTE